MPIIFSNSDPRETATLVAHARPRLSQKVISSIFLCLRLKFLGQATLVQLRSNLH
jgi:hypothetical protein